MYISFLVVTVQCGRIRVVIIPAECFIYLFCSCCLSLALCVFFHIYVEQNILLFLIFMRIFWGSVVDCCCAPSGQQNAGGSHGGIRPG